MHLDTATGQCEPLGRGGAVKIFSQTITWLINEWITEVFVEQPPALPGCANYHIHVLNRKLYCTLCSRIHCKMSNVKYLDRFSSTCSKPEHNMTFHTGQRTRGGWVITYSRLLWLYGFIGYKVFPEKYLTQIKDWPV